MHGWTVLCADLQRSRFSEKAFTVMDRDGSGEVDYIEFVLAVWNYCSFSHTSLVRFAFDLYDLDGSGEIEHEEAVRCVREVWGSAWEQSSSAQKIISKLDVLMEGTPSGKLSVQKFQEFALRHPMLLFPAFQLQAEMQKKVLGEKFWLRAAKKRGSLNPQDLNWTKVQTMSKLFKQSSSKFLSAIDDDLNDQYVAPLGGNPSTRTLPPRQKSRAKSLIPGSGRGFLQPNANTRSGDALRRGTVGSVRSALVVTMDTDHPPEPLHHQTQSPVAKKVSSPKKSAKAKVSVDVTGSEAGIENQLVLEDLEASSNPARLGSIKKAARVSSIDRIASRTKSSQKGQN